MATENERSLQKRPELVPERLMRGGLIVGVEQGIQGSLMSVTGAAIERITRERTEVPPQFKLPERPVYFLDPNTRRLIMISNRENRGENKTPDKYGLFAEIVELDEEGKPHYRLSSSEIILPDDNYHLVAVGPNSYGIPPSHIDVVEEEEGKKKFVPWNLYLGQVQLWMNNLQLDPNEDLEAYVKRYLSLQENARTQTERKIEQFFKGGNQGFDGNTTPVNLIICRDEADNLLCDVSRQAGFYPLSVAVEELVDAVKLDRDFARYITGRNLYSIGSILGDRMPRGYYPAVITADWTYLNEQAVVNELLDLNKLPELLQRGNPIFGRVEIFRLSEDEDTKSTNAEPRKLSNGMYGLDYTDKVVDMYRGLLNKLKADLLLTMFLRGGAPIVK